jgi:hypothetical protein
LSLTLSTTYMAAIGSNALYEAGVQCQHSFGAGLAKFLIVAALQRPRSPEAQEPRPRPRRPGAQVQAEAPEENVLLLPNQSAD